MENLIKSKKIKDKLFYGIIFTIYLSKELSKEISEISTYLVHEIFIFYKHNPKILRKFISHTWRRRIIKTNSHVICKNCSLNIETFLDNKYFCNEYMIKYIIE